MLASRCSLAGRLGIGRRSRTRHKAHRKLALTPHPALLPTIDPTTVNARPFHSLKSPLSSSSKKPTSSSTRRRRRLSRGKAQPERHSESIGTGHPSLRALVDLTIPPVFTVRSRRALRLRIRKYFKHQTCWWDVFRKEQWKLRAVGGWTRSWAAHCWKEHCVEEVCHCSCSPHHPRLSLWAQGDPKRIWRSKNTVYVLCSRPSTCVC